jgi:lipoprotein-anchoring transpeptidase ErfK/SrfK
MAKDEKIEKNQSGVDLGGTAVAAVPSETLSITANEQNILIPSEPLPHQVGKKWRAIGGASAACVLIAGILALLVYGSAFHLGKVQAGNVSLKTSQPDAALKKQLDQQVSAYSFSLQNPDGKASAFKLADAGITVNSAQSVANVRSKVRHLGWSKLAWWHTTTVPLVTSTNQLKFDSFVAAHIAIANQVANDATIGVVNGAANITDGTDGWTYALPGGNAKLAAAAANLSPLKVRLVKTTVMPSLQRPDLMSAKDKINAYLAHTVSFNLETTTIKPTKSDIGSWLDIEPQPDHKTVDVTVNSGKVQAYLDKAAKGSVYPPRSQITTTDTGDNTTVLISGQDGSAITNEVAVVKNVTAAMQQTTPAISADIVIAHAHFTTINAADYPKWIVVDLTTKRMYAYEHANLIRSFLVSAGAPKTPTVVGTYQIYNKLPLRTMRGANADGSRYVQPNVKYVNYFYKDYAIHGNYWRPTSYFGNINSSHGCVGIIDSDAAWLYGWAPIGTTVITHI